MIWNKKRIDGQLVKNVMKRYACDALTASILVRRGITDGSDALYMLETNMRYLSSPFLFKNMEDAVDRIISAKEEGEKVLVFGDRDVDGMTATALLYEALQDFGLDVRWQIPTGDERYGLSHEAVEKFADDDGTLIITVDCGISNFAEIEYANEKNIDVIITDHHKPQDTVPDAFTIINPQLEDAGYPLKEISGCTVAWKLVLALRFATTEMYKTSICLLNVRPINNAYTVEVRKLVNLVPVASLTEHVQEGGVSFTATRLPQFLQGQQIFVWNETAQKNLLEKIFGTSVEFNFFDLQPSVAKAFPELQAASLLRLKESSTIGKYISEKNTELDAFVNIFITFVQNANKAFSEREHEEVQLAALSTVSDLMPLKYENRMIMKLGLRAMNKKLCPCLADILSQQGMMVQHIGTHDINWFIAPVLNAAGRMGKPELAVQALIEKDVGKRQKLVGELLQMNDERKQLSETCWNEIYDESYTSFNAHNQKLVVVSSDKLNRGVSGIIASRLVNTFNVPSIVICKMDDGTATASCRSVKGFHILDLLSPNKDIFIDYGGHDYAAGFTLLQSNLNTLLENLKRASGYIEFNDTGNETVDIDAELTEQYLTPNILNYVDNFEPFGENFPELTFLSRNITLEDANIVGKGSKKHLKLNLKYGQLRWSAMYWGAGELLESIRSKKTIDIVYTVTRNYYNKVVSPQLIVVDLK